MTYSKTLGGVLAETLEEMFIYEDTGITLNEIRDLNTLQMHMAAAKEKYGVRHSKYKQLASLHQRKTAAEARRNAHMAHVQQRQEFHAKNFGYRKVAGSPGQWQHKDTGHRLSFGPDRSWSHLKSGMKRSRGGGATPIRDLRNHLASIHG